MLHLPDFKYLLLPLPFAPCTKTKLLGPLSVQLPRTTQSPCARQLPMPEPDNDKESDGG